MNGIKSYNTWTPWTTACHSLQKFEVDIFGVAETNIKWNAKLQEIARTMGQQRHFHAALLATLSSTDHTRTDYQPGGTATIITNTWTGRSTSQFTITQASDNGPASDSDETTTNKLISSQFTNLQ
jgi:hypothetical protein